MTTDVAGQPLGVDGYELIAQTPPGGGQPLVIVTSDSTTTRRRPARRPRV
ncbi:hypothetical protein AB0K48_49235 [Nonomuraea sp. NPDC055795]